MPALAPPVAALPPAPPVDPPLAAPDPPAAVAHAAAHTAAVEAPAELEAWSGEAVVLTAVAPHAAGAASARRTASPVPGRTDAERVAGRAAAAAAAMAEIFGQSLAAVA